MFNKISRYLISRGATEDPKLTLKECLFLQIIFRYLGVLSINSKDIKNAFNGNDPKMLNRITTPIIIFRIIEENREEITNDILSNANCLSYDMLTKLIMEVEKYDVVPKNKQ